MKTFLISVKGESGLVYGVYFKCETWDQVRHMIEDTRMDATLMGKVIESLQEDETDFNIKANDNKYHRQP